jgi:ornithine cyclodeaminase/alanine dehydrogenase-like protein (mu-crystallin family)
VAAAQQICVDDRAALADCGDLLAPLNANLVNARDISLIGDLLAQRSYTNEAGISLFKSIGIAAQDWAIAARVASVLA